LLEELVHAVRDFLQCSVPAEHLGGGFVCGNLGLAEVAAFDLDLPAERGVFLTEGEIGDIRVVRLGLEGVAEGAKLVLGDGAGFPRECVHIGFLCKLWEEERVSAR